MSHGPALLSLVVALGSTAALADEVIDPPVCAEAIAAQSELEPLEALESAEKQRVRDIRQAKRESRRIAKESLGTADGAGSRRRMRDLDAAERRRAQLYREAKAICLCRERRGDPYREDCQQLYPQALP